MTPQPIWKLKAPFHKPPLFNHQNLKLIPSVVTLLTRDFTSLSPNKMDKSSIYMLTLDIGLLSPKMADRTVVPTFSEWKKV
jgi:hypothetical protein